MGSNAYYHTIIGKLIGAVLILSRIHLPQLRVMIHTLFIFYPHTPHLPITHQCEFLSQWLIAITPELKETTMKDMRELYQNYRVLHDCMTMLILGLPNNRSNRNGCCVVVKCLVHK